MRMQAGGTHESADGVMPVSHVVHVKEQLTTAALCPGMHHVCKPEAVEDSSDLQTNMYAG